MPSHSIYERAAIALAAWLVLLSSPARAQPASAPQWIDREETPYTASALPTTRRPRYCRDRGELDLFGVRELSVTPAGGVWLTRDSGETFRSAGVDQPFRGTSLDCASASRHTPRGSCDRVTFFTEDIAIATGYMGDRRDTYFWTGDGGRSWEQRRFTNQTRGAWIYETQTTVDGVAWMGGSSGAMFRSTDFGRTFSALTAPYDGLLRLHSIFMVDRQRGIVGALSNGIRITRDGGQTWQTVPTPSDQGAVHPTNSTDRRVRVAWIGDALVAQQAQRVFRSAPGAVRWQPLDEFVEFAVERDGSHVFAIDAHGRVSELDASLRARRLPGARLPHPAVDMQVAGGALYVLDQSNGLHRFGAGGNVSSAASRDGNPELLRNVRRAGSLLLGLSDHMIHASADGGASWCSAAVTDTTFSGLEVRSDREAIAWGSGGLWRFDTRTGRLRSLARFGGAAVSLVHTAQRTWVATTASPSGVSAVWRSTNGGRRWTELDHWSGLPTHALVPVMGSGLLAWADDHVMQRISFAATPGLEVLGTLAAAEMPCCRSGYFATEREGFVRGYVHHMGDGVLATTDGGRTWASRPHEDFPYERVVPVQGGALAVVGGSFDYRSSSHRELQRLSNTERRTVYRAPEPISDVSVDPRGRILIELDSTPSATFELEGRRWLELSP